MTGVVVLFVVVAVGLGIGYAVSYNGLVTARQEVADAWAVIDVELDRRHTLVPALVESVRATAAHERELLTRLIEADRRAVAADHTAADRTGPEAEVAAAARAVVALRERYPALDSQRNFLQLQRELALTEDRIGAARRYHNIQVAEFNRRTEAFPSRLVASRHQMTPATYFGID